MKIHRMAKRLKKRLFTGGSVGKQPVPTPATRSKRWRNLKCPVQCPVPLPSPVSTNELECGLFRDAPEDVIFVLDSDDDGGQSVAAMDGRSDHERQAELEQLPSPSHKVRMPHFARVGPDFTRRGMEKSSLEILRRQVKRWEERKQSLTKRR